jgi:hypothetical protein
MEKDSHKIVILQDEGAEDSLPMKKVHPWQLDSSRRLVLEF